MTYPPCWSSNRRRAHQNRGSRMIRLEAWMTKQMCSRRRLQQKIWKENTSLLRKNVVSRNLHCRLLVLQIRFHKCVYVRSAIHSAASRHVSQDDGRKVSKLSAASRSLPLPTPAWFIFSATNILLSHSAPSPNTTRKKRRPIHPYPHLRPSKLFVRITMRSSATAISWSV